MCLPAHTLSFISVVEEYKIRTPLKFRDFFFQFYRGLGCGFAYKCLHSIN